MGEMDKLSKSDQHREYVKKNLAKGLCGNCTNMRAPHSKSSCQECLDYQNNRTKKRYAVVPEVRQRAIDQAIARRKSKPEGMVEKYSQGNNIKYSYFLSIEQWCKIFDFQKGRCSICDKILRNRFTGENPTGKLAATDHDHDSGEIRGLICAMPCNFLIGEVYSVDVVRRLANYMEKPPATDALGAPHYALPGRLATKLWQTRRKKYKDLPRLTELGLKAALIAYCEATGEDWNAIKAAKNESDSGISPQ